MKIQCSSVPAYRYQQPSAPLGTRQSPFHNQNPEFGDLFSWCRDKQRRGFFQLDFVPVEFNQRPSGINSDEPFTTKDRGHRLVGVNVKDHVPGVLCLMPPLCFPTALVLLKKHNLFHFFPRSFQERWSIKGGESKRVIKELVDRLGQIGRLAGSYAIRNHKEHRHYLRTRIRRVNYPFSQEQLLAVYVPF